MASLVDQIDQKVEEVVEGRRKEQRGRWREVLVLLYADVVFMNHYLIHCRQVVSGHKGKNRRVVRWATERKRFPVSQAGTQQAESKSR